MGASSTEEILGGAQGHLSIKKNEQEVDKAIIPPWEFW